ncbi:MAG TPA: chemotaxis protein CheB [Polyangiaceae bacterium]|nr:chemotaxis protein CheB [Polyangiaceae bacterium]
MTSIDVAVLDDSAICRLRLREILEADGDIRVVAESPSGAKILELLASTKPRVLLTDLVMPGVDGLAVVGEVMRRAPLPVIIVSAGGFTQVSAFEALRLGALEVAKKPDHGDSRQERALREAVRRLAGAFVVRHPGHVLPVPVAGEPPVRPGAQRVRVLGIGSSAGGPPAVASLLGALPPERAPAVLVAQHMPPAHVDDFAGFLSRRCRLEVRVCRHSATLTPGCVYVPGDGMNLAVIEPGRVVATPSSDSLTPSVDVLLSSMAQHHGADCAGVVLSGIGHDGRDGLRALAQRGALTIAQDEASCAVYGMPKAAAPFATHRLNPEQAARLVLSHVPQRERRAPAP